LRHRGMCNNLPHRGKRRLRGGNAWDRCAGRCAVVVQGLWKSAAAP
jgi:hypothetical protein